MIKDLIKQIAYEEISISKALTIAKIIAKKIENTDFEEWIKNELNGYPSDEMVPDYRQMFCIVKVEICDQWGRNVEIIPISFEAWGEEIQKHLNYQYFTQGISALETNYDQLTTDIGNFNFYPEQVTMLESMMKLRQTHRRILKAAWCEVPKLQLKHIIEQTKQRLLDTLLELDKEFPNLENDFMMTDENEKKVKNIITNNIYGNNNPVNVAAGETVSQHDIKNEINVINYSSLEELGVEGKEIEELKEIVENNQNDKPTLKSKAMKWLGSVLASVAAKGLYDNIPAITEFVEKLI